LARYYTTRLYIGTPPQEFALIVDSGSTVTYVPCATCEQCGNHQVQWAFTPPLLLSSVTTLKLCVMMIIFNLDAPAHGYIHAHT
jgi:hypothetical protein